MRRTRDGRRALPVQEQRRPAQALIARRRVTGQVLGALDAGPLLVVAGAGYGKTLALEEALATKQGRNAWVRCGPADRDAGRLLRHVLMSLGNAAPGAADVLTERLASAQQEVDVEAVAAELVDELERLVVDPLVIVFDDSERLLDSPAALAIIDKLLHGRSSAVRTAVASRKPLSLKLAKLRAAGRLGEIGPEELAFTPEECGELLRLKHERSPTAEQVGQLFAATEGWPLGASLGATHPELTAIDGTVSRDELFEFLREEVLDPEPELRRLLVDSSVPRELNSACMRALGLPTDFPDRVVQAGLPLRSVDPKAGWLAYHPLVREFLHERLEAERDPESVRDLRARVAPALAESGRPEEAVEHWLAAEAWADAVRAIGDVAPGLLHTAPDTVRQWLDALPSEHRSAAPCLLLDGILSWEAGRNVDSVERLRKAVTEFSRADDPVNEWLARMTLVDSLCLLGRWEECIGVADGFDEEPAMAAGVLAPAVAAYAATALAALGRLDECEALSRRLLAHPNLGVLRQIQTIWEAEKRLLDGDFTELITNAGEAVKAFERSDPVNRLPLFGLILAQALGHQGRDDEALEMWERDEIFARRAHMGHVIKTTHMWRALLHARAGRRGPGEAHLAEATASQGASWRDYALEAARSRLAALRGDWGAAASASESAIALAEPAALTDRLAVAIELAPVLFEAGEATRARALVDERLALCDERMPDERGSYFRSLLLGTRAWLRAANGDEQAALEDVAGMWASAGANAPDVVRREWNQLRPLLLLALERDVLDPDSVIEAVDSALPGGDVLLPLTSSSDPRVRRGAIKRAASSGHPELMRQLDRLAGDPDPDVATAAAAARARLRSSPPALTFTLLGGFAVRRGAWLVNDTAWDRRVAERLVRYLLVKRGSAVPEDILLEVFWPEKPVGSSRRGLKVAVSCARAVLDVPGADSLIEVTERTLTLHLRERDSVDVDRFEEVADRALHASEERRRLLEHAATLWTGEPLPEEHYSDWAIPWREALTLRYSEVLMALVGEYNAARDHLAAAQAARRLVELDPLDEAGQRELMIAYARSGRRGHALRQYLECRRALIDELGVDPTPETSELQQRILAGEPV